MHIFSKKVKNSPPGGGEVLLVVKINGMTADTE